MLMVVTEYLQKLFILKPVIGYGAVVCTFVILKFMWQSFNFHFVVFLHHWYYSYYCVWCKNNFPKHENYSCFMLCFLYFSLLGGHLGQTCNFLIWDMLYDQPLSPQPHSQGSCTHTQKPMPRERRRGRERLNEMSNNQDT